jgi:thioredoxin-like negative regulator of GroEL
VEVVKINTDKNPGLAEKYKVDGYPSFIVIKDGKEDKRFSGYMDIAAFEQEMMFY